MSGVVFAKVVRPRKRSSPAKAGRGDRSGVQLGPGSSTTPPPDSGQVSPSGNEVGWGSRQICPREASDGVPTRATFASQGWQWGRRSHRQDDGIRVVHFQVNAALERASLRVLAVAPELPQDFAPSAARCCAVAPDEDQPGGFFPVHDTQAGEEAPTAFGT
jgi:hypothetical protein